MKKIVSVILVSVLMASCLSGFTFNKEGLSQNQHIEVGAYKSDYYYDDDEYDEGYDDDSYDDDSNDGYDDSYDDDSNDGYDDSYDDENDDGYDDSNDGYDDGYGDTDTTITSAKVIKEFKATYGIDITDPHKLFESKDGNKYIKAVVGALDAFSPAFLKAVVADYKRYGMSVTLIISKETATSKRGGYSGLAITDGKKATATVYGNDGITTGVIAHELGHLVHYAFEGRAGETKLESAWSKYNKYGGKTLKYNQSYIGNDIYVFADEYGSTDYYEDVASNFELLAMDSKVYKKYSAKAYVAIRNKFKLLKSWCSTYLKKVPIMFKYVK